VCQLKLKINKLEEENARLRAALNDKVLAAQPKDSGSATDDDTNLEELCIQDFEKENLKQTASTAQKAQLFL
jgi:hypothetical protein